PQPPTLLRSSGQVPGGVGAWCPPRRFATGGRDHTTNAPRGPPQLPGRPREPFGVDRNVPKATISGFAGRPRARMDSDAWRPVEGGPPGKAPRTLIPFRMRARRAVAVGCDVVAHAAVRATAEELSALRRSPGTLGGVAPPASLLRHADEQTVVGLAAVLRAVE